ncbi:hypothetical protein HDU80_004476 [Chytriomyces hyalinus]|nr:hypothetical protein HDU80_004476 [Chytriomyces hyalinus]
MTISAAGLKPGAANLTYVYSPNGYGVAYVSLDETANTPAAALQILNQTLDEACSATFNASVRGFARPAFTEFTIDVAASNLTSLMDLQKEAWLCFQKMYTHFMSKNETLPDDCKGDLKKIDWFAQWPCYTGNQKNDTQGQYCVCQVQVVAPQTTSAVSASCLPLRVVIVLLGCLLLTVFV